MNSKSFKWRSAAITDVGRVRKLNEDSILDRGEVGLWVVADGMGGHSAGDLASQLIVNSLAQLEPSDDLAEFVERAEETLRSVNERLFAVANSHNQTSGSTIVLLLVCGQHAVVMWAGDSRAYRLRGEEFTKMMTDHTQIEMYIAKGLLSRAEAAGHPSGNMVTRAVGVTDNLMLEMDLFEIADGDRFLLCSDGLDKHVKDAEMAAHLREGDPEIIVQQLVELTLARGAVDNVSICVVEMTAT
jgi:serine/threonine protein phosphatase PrpC